MAEEPQLGALSNGSVVIIGHGDARSAGRNTIATALSTDHGRSFGPLRKFPGLVQPGCAVGFLIHEDVMHVSRDNNGTIVTDIVSPKIPGQAMDLHDASRNNLTVSSSSDGESWSHVLIDGRFTGASTLALIPPEAGGAAELGVLYEAGDHRFDGGGIWFAKIDAADPRPQTEPDRELPDALERPWLTPGAPPATRALALLKEMTLAEKVERLHGQCVGWPCQPNEKLKVPYVGNVLGNERLAIPQLNLNDGPQGFRGEQGTSTAWPAALSAASSWSPETMRQWGAAMGQEFWRKGSNVQLGPGLCVARVPVNGRAFEYLSGEDPYLGQTLAKATVEGIQSQHVMANAKREMHSYQCFRSSVLTVLL